MIALDPRQEKIFIAPSDMALPEDQRTRFFYGPITVREEGIIRDKMFVRDDGAYRFSGASKQYWALQCGLRRVENLRDSNGNEIKLERESEPSESGICKIKDSFLERIPANDRGLLANAIIASFEIELEAAKN